MTHIDDPARQDNRNYIYTEAVSSGRPEYKSIIDLVEPGSKVIDLGCGDGTLLEALVKSKDVEGKGIEISESGVNLCLQKKLSVSKGQIDTTLPFKDNSFDYAICNVTIQMVNYPEVLLREMKRVAKYQVVSFPNFAFYRNRLDMLLKGRMPKQMLFGYKWFSTGHIHQLSIKDYYELLNEVGELEIKKVILQKSANPVKNFLMRSFPNSFQVLPIFLTVK